MPNIKNQLLTIHDFLVRESFYTLLLSTILAGVILAGRLYLTKSWQYFFLTWNLFLAWVPYWCSLLIAGIHHHKPKNVWLLIPPTALWLLFLPNAPYIVTDLIHLNRNWDFPLWYDAGLIAAFAWTGCFLAVASLYLMQRLVRQLAGGMISWLFVLTTIALSGFGVYLGRVLRWNSWDIFTSPRPILADAVTPLLDPGSNLQAVGLSMMFAALLFVCYVTFTTRHGGNGTLSRGQRAEELHWVEHDNFSPADASLALALPTRQYGQKTTPPPQSTPPSAGWRPKQSPSHSGVEWVFTDWV